MEQNMETVAELLMQSNNHVVILYLVSMLIAILASIAILLFANIGQNSLDIYLQTPKWKINERDFIRIKSGLIILAIIALILTPCFAYNLLKYDEFKRKALEKQTVEQLKNRSNQ